MKYDSSNSRNTARDVSLPETRVEIQPAVQTTEKPVRNWAWVHNTDSYDWMDSHSLSGSRDSFH